MPINSLTFKPTDGLTLEISGIHVRHSKTYFTNLATSPSPESDYNGRGGAASAIWILTTNVLVASGFVLSDNEVFYTLGVRGPLRCGKSQRRDAQQRLLATQTVLCCKATHPRGSTDRSDSRGYRCTCRREAVYSRTYLDRQYMEDVCWRRMPTRLFLVAKETHIKTVSGRREQYGSVE